MATTEERLASLERDVKNEQEWRREMIERFDRRFDRLESNQRWLVGLLIAILIAVIASNWIG